MVNDKYFWPEEVSVGEVIYPPGGAFGPRLQRNLQLIILHSGQMTVWIDDVPHTALAETVCVLFPGHKEYYAFAEESDTWHSWFHFFLPWLPVSLVASMARLSWLLQLYLIFAVFTNEALSLKSST